jgi:tRNA G26 N,N-dimethylase Trm1
MRFHCILDKSPEPASVRFLRAACERHAVEFVLDDYSEAAYDRLSSNDLLYRTSVTQRAKAREQRLLMKNPKTFHSANELGIRQ